MADKLEAPSDMRRPHADTDPYIVDQLSGIRANVKNNSRNVELLLVDTGAIKIDVAKLKVKREAHKETHTEISKVLEAVANGHKVQVESKPLTFEWIANKVWLPIVMGVIFWAIDKFG